MNSAKSSLTEYEVPLKVKKLSCHIWVEVLNIQNPNFFRAWHAEPQPKYTSHNTSIHIRQMSKRDLTTSRYNLLHVHGIQ